MDAGRHPVIDAAARASTDITELETMVGLSMAGTVPMFQVCATHRVPATSLGAARDDCRAHAPDENIRIEDLAPRRGSPPASSTASPACPRSRGSPSRPPRSAQDVRARNASSRSSATGRSCARTRAGSGCRGGRRSSPARAARPPPSSRSSREAVDRVRDPSSSGNPIDPPRGRTQRKWSAWRSKKPSRSAHVRLDDRPRPRQHPVPRAERDQREDLRRRRRADRRVVLEPRGRVEQAGVVRRQPPDPQARPARTTST